MKHGLFEYADGMWHDVYEELESDHGPVTREHLLEAPLMEGRPLAKMNTKAVVGGARGIELYLLRPPS